MDEGHLPSNMLSGLDARDHWGLTGLSNTIRETRKRSRTVEQDILEELFFDHPVRSRWRS